MTLRTLSLLAVAALAVPLSAAPGFAADSAAPSSVPLVAGYWAEFLDHWSGVFQQKNGLVMAILAFGALCIFIITRSKWRK